MELKKSLVYFYTIQKQLQIPVNRYVYNFRCNAIDCFEKKKQEVKNCKYANVMSLLYLHYTLFPSNKISVESIRKLHFLLEDFDSFRFVFIDGIYHYHTNEFRSLSKAFYLKEYATKVDTYYERFKEKAFFKTFFYQEGAYLYVPEGTFVEKPIEILYLSTVICTKSILFHPINLIILGKGSCIKIIERHKNFRKGIEKFYINSVTEVYMHASSYLDYCKIKDDRHTTYLLDHTSILQEDRSECNINTFSFCGEFILNNLYIYQRGKEIYSHINGLSILKGNIDHNTLIEHVYPNGKSRDVYKGIFDKMANGIFNGKIIVLKSAKKTNACQKSTNILLYNSAKVNANPQLEIFAEDVKCSHGCIVGQLKTQEIFYLRSRGIPKGEAITQLLFAFAKEILECLSFQKELYFYLYKKIKI